MPEISIAHKIVLWSMLNFAQVKCDLIAFNQNTGVFCVASCFLAWYKKLLQSKDPAHKGEVR